MLSNGTSSIPHEIVDSMIEIYQPSSYIMLVHTRNTEDYNTPLHESMLNCSNFIEIVLDDVEKIVDSPPTWNKNSLLDEEFEQPIFSLLDLMHTTPWSNMQKKEKKTTI